MKDFIPENILKDIESPGKYLGIEYNRYKPGEGKYKFLLCFPDDYTIGMCSLGYHTIGKIVRENKNFSCERAFTPGVDMEKYLREKNKKLFSLESKSPAGEFDILGFSFQYELAYTNYINMMELAGLEPLRKQRTQDSPVIMGGGPTCVNPAILSEFMDVVVVGEAEPVLPDILDSYNRNSKEKFLKTVSKLPGVFVPGINSTVKRVFYKEFKNDYYPQDQPVPTIRVPHGRISMEINRGCKGSCRFCQATNIYGPYREKSVSDIVSLCSKTVSQTGYDEITLTSLSGTDHEDLELIMDELHFSFKDLGVSTVMSSMKPHILVDNPGFVSKLQRRKQGGLTFAPEAASEKLKRVINKRIDNEKIVEAVVLASRSGWKNIKLYFILGLPGEKKEDLKQVINLVKKIKNKSGLNINITLAPLTPQSHTPFQWVENRSPEELKRKIKFVKSKIPAKVNTVNFQQYIIENILARGGKNLAQTVVNAHKYGARLDQWGEHFDFEAWQKAFRDENKSWEDYYYRDYSLDTDLPWDCVDIGVKKSYFKRAYKRALKVIKEYEKN
ncbi:MAG: radical SAM protein [Elusimicrobiota bacterium]